MAQKPNKDDLITLSQASELYGLSVSYLRELAQRERMAAKKLGAQWVTTPRDVEAYIKSRSNRGAFKEDI